MTEIDLTPQYAFGTNATKALDTFIKKNHFDSVLVLLGKTSSVKSGAWEQVLKVLEENNTKYVEYKDVKSNPRDFDIIKAAKLGIENKVQFVIALGGGSIMDTAKVVTTFISNPDLNDVRAFFEDQSIAKNLPIPVVTIPLTAATASENNAFVVINLTDKAETEKVFYKIPACIPSLCIQDPNYIKTNSDWHVAAGLFDAFCHNEEQYFGRDTFSWTQKFQFMNTDNLLEHGPEFLKDRNNDVAASNLLWTASMSFNPLSGFNSDADWSVHALEHALSAKWDVTHGAGLALVMPTYLKLRSAKEAWFREKAIVWAKSTFGVDTIEAMLEKLTEFIGSIGLPLKWSDFKEIGQKPTAEEIHSLVGIVRRTVNPAIDDEFIYQVFDSIPA
ncbi:iron-containing alcohol dehydrogenase [Ureaplasma ceti]|uniref:Iron-containing alcohol dehydrogenase n=1 Tax=Ureaplasma ceti TaxID=3119530 RepID=A0ABP9U9M6_9BACT